MPRGDGTGPLGLGPMTGKGRGRCLIPLGFGLGALALGRANRRAQVSDAASTAAIKDEIGRLEQRLAALKDLLEEEAE